MATPLTRHDAVHTLVRIEKAFMQIRLATRSQKVKKLCGTGITETVLVGDALYPELLAEIRGSGQSEATQTKGGSHG